jgi:hypothetical protein
MRLADRRAILAIDPTPRGLAFVFFLDGEVADWGTRRVPDDDLGALERILTLCPADVLVIEDGEAEHCLRRPRVKRLLLAIEAHAKAEGLEMQKVSAHDALQAWKLRGCANKSEMAAAIAREFAPLDMLAPRLRGKYRSEDARISIFDAASFATHVFGVKADTPRVAA